ncbi:MAG: mRNA splicing protein prp18 [Chrysothrix sp. TS-e1954]|nr:MAG: mRNA splicing protein prp18 [Chrysothrix sp. TS-e1954]
MDFASAMSAQLAKASGPSTPKDANVQSKYLKRSELEAERERAYLADKAAREQAQILKVEQKRKRDEEETERNRGREAKRQRLAEESKQRQQETDERAEKDRRQRLGLPERPPSARNEDSAGAQDASGSNTQEDLSDKDLTIRLRNMKEPSYLFGEDYGQRLQRLHRLETRRKAVSAISDPNQPIPTTLEPVAVSDIKLPSTLPPASDAAARVLLARQLTTWFNHILLAWGIALAQRPDSVKSTFSGQAALKSQLQALAHLKPLFRKLEHFSSDPSLLPQDLLSPMLDIVRAAQERRYVDANDGYLQLSIGNAAWPIGVTMVGIHERSAREKLHETDKGKAHIMADESTRKILQSIKRCLSFAQTKWPPDDLAQLMG